MVTTEIMGKFHILQYYEKLPQAEWQLGKGVIYEKRIDRREPREE